MEIPSYLQKELDIKRKNFFKKPIIMDVHPSYEEKDWLLESKLTDRDLIAFRKAVRQMVHNRPINASVSEVKNKIALELPSLLQTVKHLSETPSSDYREKLVAIVFEEMGFINESLEEAAPFLDLNQIAQAWWLTYQLIVAYGSSILSPGVLSKIDQTAQVNNLILQTNKLNVQNVIAGWSIWVASVWAAYEITKQFSLGVLRGVREILWTAARYFWRKITHVPTHRVVISTTIDPEHSKIPQGITAYLKEGEEYRFNKTVRTLSAENPSGLVKSLERYVPFTLEGYISVGKSQDPPHFILIKPLAGSIRGEQRYTALSHLAHIEHVDGTKIKVEG